MTRSIGALDRLPQTPPVFTTSGRRWQSGETAARSYRKSPNGPRKSRGLLFCAKFPMK